MLSENMAYSKKFKEVKGKQLAYVDEGTGDPIVLLHGNPTSSYLWRNVIPELTNSGRVIVPDLIGQGDSEKIAASEGADRYSFHVAYDYLAGLLDALGINQNVTLVIHDWGTGLGFHWANLHRDAIKAIAYMEGFVTPLTWQDWPEGAQGVFKGMRSEKGEELVLNRNAFIEKILPSSVIRPLSETEMDHYRAPFKTPEDRQPTLNWPRTLPIDGEPADIVALISDYASWLEKDASVPKLFINAEPGSILVGRQREYCRSWPNQNEVTVKGLHFIQEDSPVEIGQAVAQWLKEI
ncbi:MAG: haloalkane dehalogenase [Bermanella sp.]